MKKRLIQTKEEYLQITICAVAIFVMTYVMVCHLGAYEWSDYSSHAMWSEDIISRVIRSQMTYPMWHVSVYCVWRMGRHFLFDMPIIYAAAFVTATANMISYYIIAVYFSKNSIKNSGALSCLLMFVSAVWLPWFSATPYAGIGSPNTWHNPTNIMVKPFAILSTLLIIDMCTKIKESEACTKKEYIILTILLLGGALAKASFFQGIVPALGIYFVISLFVNKGRGIISYIKMISCFIPAFAVIVYTFVVSFYSGSDAGGIGIGWLGATSHTTDKVIFSLFLVLSFPIIYFIANFRKLYKFTSVHIVILFTICSWLESMLIYEQGERRFHGNFSWACQLAYSVCWILSSKAFFKDWQRMDIDDRKELYKNVVLCAVWGLHFASGILYYCLLIGPSGIQC